MVYEEKGRHPPPRAWQIPTSAHLKIQSKQQTRVQNLQYPPPQFHRLITSVVEASTPKKKKINT